MARNSSKQRRIDKSYKFSAKLLKSLRKALLTRTLLVLAVLKENFGDKIDADITSDDYINFHKSWEIN